MTFDAAAILAARPWGVKRALRLRPALPLLTASSRVDTTTLTPSKN